MVDLAGGLADSWGGVRWREVGVAGTGGSEFCGFNPKGPRVKSEMRLGGQLAGSRYLRARRRPAASWWAGLAGNQVRRCGRHLVGVAVSPSVDVRPLCLGP